MTVIVWDGKVLAADRRGSRGGTVFTIHKVAACRWCDSCGNGIDVLD